MKIRGAHKTRLRGDRGRRAVPVPAAGYLPRTVLSWIQTTQGMKVTRRMACDPIFRAQESYIWGLAGGGPFYCSHLRRAPPHPLAGVPLGAKF